jgi:anti-sigma B factor antagonist/stage II sporulation protein AA (anti-sigma F factor antagonist)
MNCNETKFGGAVVLKVAGRVDLSNADEFKDKLTAALGNAPGGSATGGLVVDLGGVDYISSAGLRSLMIVFKASKAAGKQFAITSLQPLLMEIFTISRFHLVFPLFDTARAAIEKQVPDALGEFDSHK